MENIIHEFLISRIKNSRITFHILAEKSLEKFYGTKKVSVYKFVAEECWPKIRVERAPERYWLDCIKTGERQRVVHVQVAFI